MGNIPDTIIKSGLKKNFNILLNIKLTKLRDYFASFKSICDNFSIDLSEFEHIFGATESSFVVWDTDNNGLIDSLELFSGIAIFSDTKLEDKIRCNESTIQFYLIYLTSMKFSTLNQLNLNFQFFVVLMLVSKFSALVIKFLIKKYKILFEIFFLKVVSRQRSLFQQKKQSRIQRFKNFLKVQKMI